MPKVAPTHPRRPGTCLFTLAALVALLAASPRPTHPGPAPMPGPAPTAMATGDLQILVASLNTQAQPQEILPKPGSHFVRLAVAPHTVRLAVDPDAAHPLSGPVAVRQHDHLGGPGRTLRLVSLADPEPPSALPAPTLADASVAGAKAVLDAAPAPIDIVVKNMSPVPAQPASPGPEISLAAASAPQPAVPPAVRSGSAPAKVQAAATGRSILVAGDSLSIYLAEALRPLLAARPGAAFAARGKISSGLARPDFFNWEREMATLAAASRPDTVVVMIATNDNQTLTRSDGKKLAFGRPGWNEEYGRRIRRLVELARQGNPDARVYWIGAPVMADPRLNADVAAINAVIAGEIAALPGCRYVDVSRTLADASGRYTPALPAPGGSRIARTPDGVHLTAYGAKLLAHATLASMSTAVASLETR